MGGDIVELVGRAGGGCDARLGWEGPGAGGSARRCGGGDGRRVLTNGDVAGCAMEDNMVRDRSWTRRKATKPERKKALVRIIEH